MHTVPTRLTVLALGGLLSAVGLGSAACSGAGSGASSGITVIASFYPFAFVASRVGGADVQVENLTSPGAEPHDLELTPRQIADLSEASLVVYEHGFQPAVDDAVDQSGLGDDARVDVTEAVPLEDTGAPAGGAPASGASGLDPHVWLDPVRMQAVTRLVAARLASVDPAHAADYHTNATDLLAQLAGLDRAYRAGLAHCSRMTVVTSHAAFGYLAQRYGLTQIPIAGLDPTSEPAPAQQAAIADLVRRDGITTIFTETLVSPAVAQSIADEAGVSVATLDPIEGLSDSTSDQTYLTLMRSNLATLRAANGCS